MPESESWVWTVVIVSALIAFVVSLGDYHRYRIEQAKIKNYAHQDYQRVKELMATYEEQQRNYQFQQEQAANIMERLEAILDRIERLLGRVEGQYRS